MKSFLIIGMGHFGHHLCRSLAETDCEIMIVDQNEEALEDMLPYVVSAKIGDCTNIEVLKTFDIPSFDTCFVCIGENFQNSLEITSLLKDECGAKRVISKADRDIQEKFLLKNGREPAVSELAGILSETEENISEALCAAAPVVSLTVGEDEGGGQTDIPVESPEDEITERLSVLKAVSDLDEIDMMLI